MIKIFIYLKGSLEEETGKPSAKRLTALFFVAMVFYTDSTIKYFINKAIFTQVKDPDNSLKMIDVLKYLFLAECCMILLLFGVLTVQQIMNLRTGLKYGATDPPQASTDPQTK